MFVVENRKSRILQSQRHFFVITSIISSSNIYSNIINISSKVMNGDEDGGRTLAACNKSETAPEVPVMESDSTNDVNGNSEKDEVEADGGGVRANANLKH